MSEIIAQKMLDKPQGLSKQITRREMLKASLKIGAYAVGASLSLLRLFHGL